MVTCVLAIFVENKIPARQEVVALVVLCAGVMLSVWQGSVSGRPQGIVFCVAGTLCNGAMMTFSGKVLNEKIDVVRLTFYTAPVSLACLMPFFLFFERTKFVEYYALHSGAVRMIMTITSINALAYNMIHSLMIKKTSAVTTTVLGELKIVGLLVLSALLLGEGKEFTMKMTLGCILAMVGFGMFSHHKLVGFKQQHAKVLSLADDEEQPLTAGPASPLIRSGSAG